jgi:regulator of replication initiation timing
MAKVATRGLELEPIDRLEEKLKLLVAMVDRLKAEQARAVEDNQRLARELEAALRGERDAIRTRVVDMLDQLEALNL